MSATRSTLAAAVGTWALALVAAVLWMASPAPTLAGPAPAAVVHHLDTSDRPVEPVAHAGHLSPVGGQ